MESILNTMPLPYILTGDFNAQHPIWGSTRTNLRGRHLAELADDYHLSTINGGTPTYFYGTEGSSCLDLTFVSAALTSQTTWFADIETRGSDHVPTYTTINGFTNVRKTNFLQRTNWHMFEEAMTNECKNVTELSHFKKVTVSCAEKATRDFNVPSTQKTIDAEYERLRPAYVRGQNDDPGGLKTSKISVNCAECKRKSVVILRSSLDIAGGRSAKI